MKALFASLTMAVNIVGNSSQDVVPRSESVCPSLRGARVAIKPYLPTLVYRSCFCQAVLCYASLVTQLPLLT